MTEFKDDMADQYQPPTFSDAEAQAVVEAVTAIAAQRGTGNEGEPSYEEYVMGVTGDGMLVSVDECTMGVKDRFAVRTGEVAGLVVGASLVEQRLDFGTVNARRWRGGPSLTGVTTLKTEQGRIYIPDSKSMQAGRLPTIDRKGIFPIGEDGRPVPSMVLEAGDTLKDTVGGGRATENAGQEGAAVVPEQVATRGLLDRFRRR